MSEPLRYALVILISGQLIGLYKIHAKRKSTINSGNAKTHFAAILKNPLYFLTPLTIIAATQVYIFLAFTFPFYVIIISHRRKPVTRALLAIAGGLMLAVPSYCFLNLTASTYSFSNVDALREAFNEGALSGVKHLIYVELLCLRDFFKIETAAYGAMFVWETFCYAALWIICVFASAYEKFVKKKSSLILTLTMFALPVYLAAFCLVYQGADPTFTVFRISSICLIFAAFVLTYCGNYIVRIAVAVSCLLGMFCLPGMAKDGLFDGRFVSQTEIEKFMSTENELKQLRLSDSLEESAMTTKSKSPGINERSADDEPSRKAATELERERWSNTVSIFVNSECFTRYTAMLPAGVGVNMMSQSGIDTNSGYILLDTVDCNALPYEDRIRLETQYQAINIEKNIIIFEKKLQFFDER